MKHIRTQRIARLIARLVLFALILSLGTLAALVAGETQGLALADLSEASVQTLTTTANSQVLYASLAGDVRPAGIYRSDDYGRTWQRISAGPGMALTALAAQSSDAYPETVLFAGTLGGPGMDHLWMSYDD
jgi:hypothetical protein